MCMSFGVFHGNAEVKNMRVENKPFFRYFKIFDLVVFFGIQDMLTVCGQPFSQVDIIGITAQTFPVVWNQFYCSFFYFFQYSGIGKNHFSF